MFVECFPIINNDLLLKLILVKNKIKIGIIIIFKISPIIGINSTITIIENNIILPYNALLCVNFNLLLYISNNLFLQIIIPSINRNCPPKNIEILLYMKEFMPTIYPNFVHIIPKIFIINEISITIL